jgi:hypothetical protein
MSRCRSYAIQLIPGVHLTFSLLAPQISASVTRPSSQYHIAPLSSRTSIVRLHILSSIAPVLRPQLYHIRDLESVSRRHSLFSPAKYLYPNPFVSLQIPTTTTLPLPVTAQPKVPNLHSAVLSLFLLLRGIVVVQRSWKRRMRMWLLPLKWRMERWWMVAGPMVKQSAFCGTSRLLIVKIWLLPTSVTKYTPKLGFLSLGSNLILVGSL